MKSPHLDRISGLLLLVVSTLTAKLARQGSILAGKRGELLLPRCTRMIMAGAAVLAGQGEVERCRAMLLGQVSQCLKRC